LPESWDARRLESFDYLDMSDFVVFDNAGFLAS
jgi:hypothetical protein